MEYTPEEIFELLTKDAPKPVFSNNEENIILGGPGMHIQSGTIRKDELLYKTSSDLPLEFC